MMRCLFICCLSLYISTCIAVLYTGEAPQYTVAAAVEQQLQQQQQQQQQHQLHQLQFEQRQLQEQQQQQHFVGQQSLPEYNNTFAHSLMSPKSPAESSHFLAGYRYNAPTAIATTAFRPPKTTTATTTIPTDPKQTANLGYTYGLPVEENSLHHAYYAPYHQLNRQTAAALQSSTSNNFESSQSLALSSEPTSNIFATNEVPAETLQPQAPHLLPATKNENESEEDLTKLLTPYQRVFREFADYLLWRRRRDGELKREQRLQQFRTLQQEKNTQEESHVNLSPLQNQFVFTAPPAGVSNRHAPQPTSVASLAQQTFTQSTQRTPRNEFTLQRPTLAWHPTISNGATLNGEPNRSNDNNENVNYFSKPSESLELPSYNNVEFALPQQRKLSIGLQRHKQEGGAYDQYKSVDKSHINDGTIVQSEVFNWKQQQLQQQQQREQEQQQQKQQNEFTIGMQNSANETKLESQTQSQFIKPAGGLSAYPQFKSQFQQQQELLQQSPTYFHSTQKSPEASPLSSHNSQLSGQTVQSNLSNFDTQGGFNSDTTTLRRPHNIYGVPLRSAFTT